MSTKVNQYLQNIVNLLTNLDAKLEMLVTGPGPLLLGDGEGKEEKESVIGLLIAIRDK